MRTVTAALTIAVGSLLLASAQASPVTPGGMSTAFEALGGIEPVHCTPGKNHHFPTWNYQRDGCRRPSKSKKKAPPKAKSS